ncbi:MAG: hypothetical protein ABR577_07370 [Pyrinomonadaceae bacterium]
MSQSYALYILVLVVTLAGCSKPESTNVSTKVNDNSASSSVPTEKVSNSESANFLKVFEGTINAQYPIEMNLQRNDRTLSGTYFYTKHKVDISIKGTVDEQDNFVLNEFDQNGNQTGIFKGRFVSSSSIEGTWSKPSGDKSMPFSLVEKEGGNSKVASNQTGLNSKFFVSDESDDADPDAPPSEAQQQAAAFWDKHIAKCGGSYYWQHNTLPYYRRVYECQEEPNIIVKGTTYSPKQLSKVEKLNGVDPLPVEWSGNTKANFTVCREKNFAYNGPPSPSWGKWQDSISYEVSMEKRKGKWNIRNPLFNGITNEEIVAIKCSDVPK